MDYIARLLISSGSGVPSNMEGESHYRGILMLLEHAKVADTLAS
jgi:hypothetical protein